MESLLNDIVSSIQLFVSTSNILLSILLGFFIIILESIIPILPLSVFIAINVIAFGQFPALIISWLGTTIGCMLSFFFFRKIRDRAYNFLYKHTKLINFINKIDTIPFASLVCLLAMPFTPAFSINIAAGLSKMEYKKYLLALLSSKIFAVYFWTFIATTFLESVTDVTVIIKIGLLILCSYVISKIVNKKFKL